MGPLPRTVNGKLYILVAIDYMTRWIEAQSVAKVNEKTVSKFVYIHICCRFGTPLEIVFDNGPGFRRGLLTEVCEELKVSHRHSTPYYPQSNGLVEKANGIIAGIIRKMVESRQEQNNDEAWIDRLLNLVELEWKREAAYHCYEKKALQLRDKLNEGIKDKEIKEKSLVLRYNNALDNRVDAKFERRWEGPFIVKKAFTGGYYQLMDLNGKEHPRKVNGYRLKPYLSRVPKTNTKSQTITVFVGKVRESLGEQTPVTESINTTPFPKTQSTKLEGVFFVQDVMQSLSDLNRFICNQEAMILTLETQKAEGKGLTLWNGRYVESNCGYGWDCAEFQLWADGLRVAIENQIQEVEDKIAHLIADNNFLTNQLKPLVDLEKDTLDGQGVTGVLIAEAEVETLKKEVIDYMKELWPQAAGLFQEHMAKPIDRYKSWFEAIGEYKV
ncbi:hypothetical protein L7F22_022780 [Adiantum nelumboides]|nr:hypothetical protein [Adiantum nelumboides]